ncbi:hypothetical protein [Chitinimonas sp.]|uniref:hypothetical protein n=1 Tax=Chitinimonas sp. TaxID=1934313 RepID=UPI002F95EB82
MADEFADMPDFLAELESGELPAYVFDHRGHVFAAWAAMRLHGVERGAMRFRQALRRYTEHLGAMDKYHVTLTEALLHLVAYHLPEVDEAAGAWREQWRVYQQRAGSLLHSSHAALAPYYSAALIDTADARRQFLLPDLAPLP